MLAITRTRTRSHQCVHHVPPNPQALQSDLQRAISEVNDVVSSRGKGGQVSAKALGSASNKLQQTLDTAMTAGLSTSDALVAKAETLLSTLGEMQTQVSQAHIH